MDRTLGIVGGTGPESTVDYYRSIIAGYRRRRDGAYPRVIINSVDASRVLDAIAKGDIASIADDLLLAVAQLAAAGAGAALFASNAVHLALDAVAQDSPIPLLSIVDATADEAKARGLSRVGLLGLRFLAEAPLYPERLARDGIDVVRPPEDAQTFVHDVYLGELVSGIFRDDTRDKVVQIISAMHDRDGVEAVILGGTELSLLLAAPSSGGVPLLHTAHIHADRAVDWLLSVEPALPESGRRGVSRH